MQAGRIESATRVMGSGQAEYTGLPIRDEVIDCGAPLGEVPAMRSAWLPTPSEIAAINAGASVHLVILGTVHPPVMVTVGPAIIEQETV